MEEKDIQNDSRWYGTFRKIGIILYIAIIMLEVIMYFVLNAQNMIYEDIGTYLKLYLFRPVLISTLIMAVGSVVIRKSGNPDVKKSTQLIMITLMFGNVAIIHNVFTVALAVFCIPIFLTVVFRDKRLLNGIAILSEVIVVYIAAYSRITQSGAGKNKYYIASVIIVMIMLFACKLIAGMSINMLNAQHQALLEAMQKAQEAQKVADLSNQSKSIFLSSMSHEIRTPINSVLGLDEMIIRESTEPEIREYALDIRSSGKVLLGLVNDVLDFSKIESGKLDLMPVEYDVSSVINDLVNMIATRASDKGLSFEVEVSSEIPHRLYGDEIRIKQIIMNLLTNAVKYTDRGEVRLCVSYEKIDEENIRLGVMVRDTGRGIKKEDLAKLFAPFERIEESKNRNIEGTGLGMSITKRLLALMDSELQVESVYGLGSDFSFEIVQKVQDWEPIGNYEEAYRKLRNEEKQYRELFTAPDARVLVVDDTPVNLKVFQYLLKQTKVQIDVAHSGMECLQKASREKYHIIFIDHMMPEMDGIETMKRLKGDEESLNKDTPLIALSANAIAGSREAYLREGFTEYLMKPIEPSKLERTLIAFLPKELVKLTE